MPHKNLTAFPPRQKDPGETRNVLVNMTGCLDEDAEIDEKIASITSVTCVGLNISNPQVTTVERLIDDEHVEAGKAIQFIVSGGTAGTDYSIKVVVVTTGGQTIVRYLPMEVPA